MAYIYGDRSSRVFFPNCVDKYVSEDDPVRVYDAMVDQFDLDDLGIKNRENVVGAPSYDRRAMLKLLVYGYSQGVTSSRLLELRCYRDVSFMWLLGDLKPGFKAISEFRRNNFKALQKVLSQCAHVCLKVGLIDGNIFFVDGTKMKANASLSQTWTEKKCKTSLEKLSKRAAKLLEECESIDKSEENLPSLVKLEEELSTNQKRREKIKAVLSELESQNLKNTNRTDKDCVLVKTRQGRQACYNSQIVVDEKHGLIVSSDVVSQANDSNQLSKQIQQAEEGLDLEVKTVCADAGYWQLNDLEKESGKGKEVIVPSKKQAGKKEPGDFDKDNFEYDADADEYICPQGKRLQYGNFSKKDNAHIYRMKPYHICLDCEKYGICTEAKRGRSIYRLINEEYKNELAKKYDSQFGQGIYRLRKQKVELPFGYIKKNIKAGTFLLRGRELVKAEFSLLATGFNIKRMINLMGVAPLMAFLKEGLRA